MMTSPSSPAIDRSVAASAQSGDPPQHPLQSTDYVPKSDGPTTGNDSGNAKENISPRGEPPGTKHGINQSEGEKQNDEFDDFGLPIRARPAPERPVSNSSDEPDVFHDVEEDVAGPDGHVSSENHEQKGVAASSVSQDQSGSSKQMSAHDNEKGPEGLGIDVQAGRQGQDSSVAPEPQDGNTTSQNSHVSITRDELADSNITTPESHTGKPPVPVEDSNEKGNDTSQTPASHARQKSMKASEWSHQRLADDKQSESESDESDHAWRDMPALDEFDVYDDFGRLVARGAKMDDNEGVYSGLGGSGKGYTRVQLDEDAQSATSLDEDTSYLFKEANNTSVGVEGEELRDHVDQLQATKDLLTESQRIAYVGVTRLSMHQMALDLEKIPLTKGTRKATQKAMDGLKKWSQMMMARLYSHMDINSAEQIMIEQLAEHGVDPADLVRPLMENARVKNPLADTDSPKKSTSSATSPGLKEDYRTSISSETDARSTSTPPPPYEMHEGEDIPEVRTPSQLPTSDKIDIDLRWTVLCDLFLVLIADSSYDSRSRTLLERVGNAMEVSWLQIARFEKRVIDALEMQESAAKETWDESDNMEKRRKMALKRKYMVMGLATVGGGLVIGLSAGLLAPVIGAGMAAGLTTIGVSGTSAFLGGAGGTALIASGATLTGGTMGMRASHRRTGAVQTFEYRPLHNNKRVNLIITVGGWMNGKLDDIRLPYSTVDPIMGDLYSVLWEPEMLQSMGDTINILATEALTQGLQHALGSTILVALVASLQLPLVLTKLSYLIDNPWNVSLARANAAGLILADSLMAHNLGKRPVTLLGFSLGSRVIFSCLKELAEKGAHGLVQNVYLFGSPVVGNKDEYLKARSVISGRFVNGYSSNDWILGYLFRATSGGIMRVAGLAPVEGIPGLENFNLTHLVNGHMDYRAAIPRLLKEVGWEVLSEEFSEIEDPDPENHSERQRELIRELDEARKQAELKPEKKRFGLFKRGKLAKKKGWETYDVDRNAAHPPTPSGNNDNGSVLFDIDAIKAELASEMIEVKQLESTLPPMKLDLSSPSSKTSAEPSPSSAPEKKGVEASSTVPQVPPGSEPLSLHDPHSPTNEEVEMSFDTSFHEVPHRSHSLGPTTATGEPHSSRPELKSSATMPAGVGASALGAMALEPNAWAEHDIGHGEEGEVQMSFE